MLINNTIMNLKGPIVRHITAEILHHVKSLCIIYMDNLLVRDHWKIPFVSPLQEQVPIL